MSLNIPDSFNEIETKRFLAAKIYESGRLTLGQAAEIARLSKIAFAEILAEYNISIVNYPASEVIEDAEKF